MKLSCAFPPHPAVLEHVALAESLGYDRAWLYDSPALYADVWTVLGLAAQRCERIGLGTAVLVPSLRHVLATASAIATIELLAPGRLAVAVGTGYTGRKLMGQPPLAWSAVERYVEQLRALLAGETVRIDGGVTRMLQPQGFAPARPIATPIYVAANGPRGIGVARRIADGTICAGVIPEGFEAGAHVVWGTVVDAGEAMDSDRVFDAVGAAVAVIYHSAYDASPAGVESLPGGAAWRAEIEQLPAEGRALHVHADHAVKPTARDLRHIDRSLVGATFTGTREQLRARATDLAARGVTELVYAPLGSDVPRELRAMRDAVDG